LPGSRSNTKRKILRYAQNDRERVFVYSAPEGDGSCGSDEPQEPSPSGLPFCFSTFNHVAISSERCKDTIIREYQAGFDCIILLFYNL